MQKAALLVAFAFMAVSPAYAESLIDPVGLRGINLGITFAEFVKTPYPDKEKYDARPVCTGDKIAKDNYLDVELGADYKAVGVKMCRFYYLSKVGSISRWSESGIGVGDHSGLQTMFLFTPKSNDPTTSERLFIIRVRMSMGYLDNLVAVYKVKYGEPHGTTNEPVQNQLGATFDSALLIWTNPHTMIAIKQRADRVDVSSITYVDTGLQDTVDQLIKAKAKAAADKL